MKALLSIKIMSLVLALIGVIYVMLSLNPDSVSRAFHAMGIETGTAQSPGFQPSNRPLAPGESRTSLCRTRVHAIVWPNGHKVEEKQEGLKLTWMAHDPQPREISYLAVEKWLSQHCQIVTSDRPFAEGESLRLDPYLTIVFIDGSKTEIMRGPDGTFALGELNFKSEDLEQAVEELVQIAQLANGSR